jgi:hypothetical protein
MPNYEPLDYRLRCHSKRTDLPPDVLRDICEAYEEMERLRRYAHYCRPQSGSNHKLRSNIDRTDLPSDVIDDIRYAYGEIIRIYKLLDDQTETTQKAFQERDEARRMYCKCHAQAEAVGYAEGRGWDCFKEDKN